MKKLACVIISMVLLVGLLLVGCSTKSSPVPTQAVQPSTAATTAPPSQATTAKPSTTAPASQPSAAPTTTKPHEQVTLTIYTGPTTTSNWALTQCLSDMSRKYHPWLRLDVKDTTGETETVRIMAENPQLRKTCFIYTGLTGRYQAKQGLAPFTKPYTTLAPLARIYTCAAGFVTFDQNVKTIADLAGKKVDIGTKGSAGDLFYNTPTFKAAGIDDKVNKQYLGFGPGKDALSNGLIDANWQSLVQIGMNPTVIDPGANVQQLLAVTGKTLNFVDIPENLLVKARSEVAILSPILFPKGALKGTSLPKEDVHWADFSAGWMADTEFPTEYAYEVVKLISDHLTEFKDYHPAGNCFLLQGMTGLPIPKAEWHPGAVKFYDEKGVKLAD